MRANEQQNNALLGALQNILTELKALNSSSADLWDKDDIARYLKKSKSTVEKTVVNHKTFPKPAKIPSGGHPLWEAANVKAWATKQR